jgi:hypothetical protein
VAAKHSVRVFGTARFILSFGVAILVLLVVWIAVRAVGPAEASKPPTVVLPSVPRVTLVPPPASASPSVASSRSTAPSRTPSAAPTRKANPTSRAPEKTRTPSTPPAEADVEAALRVTASWDSGYVAMVSVVNDGDKPIDWRVTVSHDDLKDLRLGGVWNARGNQQGTSMVFQGGTLAPGAEARFGYQASANGRGKARPATCNAVGGSCRVR